MNKKHIYIHIGTLIMYTYNSGRGWGQAQVSHPPPRSNGEEGGGHHHRREGVRLHPGSSRARARSLSAGDGGWCEDGCGRPLQSPVRGEDWGLNARGLCLRDEGLPLSAQRDLY